jgi:4-hydroxybenzoate polyprenyltransferase
MKRIARKMPNAIDIGMRESWLSRYFLALRPHQWLKNSLVALPAIAAHHFTTSDVLTVLLAFISFSLGASSIYLINDMIDIPYDRTHPQKRHRALAAGVMPLSHALMLLAVFAMLSIGLAFMLPWAFTLTLIAYFGLSMGYSFYLKSKLMIDVVSLAMLYGIRVFAGAAATGIALSHWLVGFCFFIFLCLALVKRTAEVLGAAAENTDKIMGRDYRQIDLQTITGLTAAAGFVAVLVLAFYISSPDVVAIYTRPELLWGICVILIYWVGRVCFLTGRGEMHEDPVIFAATDRVSLLTCALIVAVFLAAL